MLGCKNLAAIGLPPHVVIFVKYREVSTRTMLLNFIDLSAETALYSRFGGHKGGVVKGEKGEEEEAHVFNLILLANQSDSLWQPKRSLRIATAVRYSYYVQLVAIRRDWMRVPNLKSRSARQRGGGEAGRAHHCILKIERHCFG